MKTILVTGSTGQLGQELKDISPQYNFQFLFTDSTSLDIRSERAVRDFFATHTIDFCINGAAYTAVDKAESDQQTAFEVNKEGALFLARACTHANAPIIHISTDFVFDGKQQFPYTEMTKENPLGVYGLSKLEGERAVQQANKKAIIIRTSWLYSCYGKNFMKTMLQLSKQRDSLGVVADQFGTPTYARDLANAIMQIIVQLDQLPLSNCWGLYHYSNEGIASWYEFAKAIFEFSSTTINLKAISTSDYPTPAKRPAYSVMDKSKIKKTFNISIPPWEESLADCIKKLK